MSLERMAADELNSAFKDQLLEQAIAYRKLAKKRAQQYGLPLPRQPEPSS